MKILSITQEDGRVVEFSRQEFRQLSILAAALEGMSENEAHGYFDFRMQSEIVSSSVVDLEGVFGAIKAFYEARFRVNELKKLVSVYEKYLEKHIEI